METGASRLDPNPLQLGCPHSMENGIGKTICDMSFVIYCINEKRRFMLANRYYRYVNLDTFFFCENVANTFQSFQKVILKQPWSKVVSRMGQIRTWTAECLVPWRNTGPGMILCTVPLLLLYSWERQVSLLPSVVLVNIGHPDSRESVSSFLHDQH